MNGLRFRLAVNASALFPQQRGFPPENLQAHHIVRISEDIFTQRSVTIFNGYRSP